MPAFGPHEDLIRALDHLRNSAVLLDELDEALEVPRTIYKQCSQYY